MVSKPCALNIQSKRTKSSSDLFVCMLHFLPEDQRDNLGYKSLNPQIISKAFTIRGHPLTNINFQLIKMPVRQQGKISLEGNASNIHL